MIGRKSVGGVLLVNRFLFLLPVLVLFTAFFLYPFLFILFTSFTQWRGIGSMEFAGFVNYVTLVAERNFHRAVANNMIWAACLGFIQVPLACLVAMILARRPKGWHFLRTVFFLPNVISTVAIAMVWVAMYNTSGPINFALNALFGMEPRNWLGDPSTALGAIIFQTVIYIGYFMIVIFAATLNISQTLYEAAKIDGANVFQQEWHITLPMLRGVLVTTITLAMAFGIRHFEATYLMTGGGPAFVTTTLGIDLFQRMDALRYSEATTTGIFLILLGTVVITILRRIAGSADPMSDASQ